MKFFRFQAHRIETGLPAPVHLNRTVDQLSSFRAFIQLLKPSLKPL